MLLGFPYVDQNYVGGCIDSITIVVVHFGNSDRGYLLLVLDA
jgi:hypothetical protein